MSQLKNLAAVLFLVLGAASSAQAFIDATATKALQVAEMKISKAKMDVTKLSALASLKETIADRLENYDDLPPVKQLDYNDFRSLELTSLTEFNINLKQIKFSGKRITDSECLRSRDKIMLYSEKPVNGTAGAVSSETQKALALLDLLCKK